MANVEFGIGLTAGPPKGQIERWLDDLDEQLPALAGHFTSLWMTDHFFWEDEPTYEAWTVLAFAAARWPQFEVGPMVLGQSYRNPALLAKMGATLQTLSRGRFIMAVGAGWKEDEYCAYGYPYPSAGVRIEQLEDTLEIIKRMWTEPGKVTYQGKHYQIVDAYCEPKPDPVPLIMVGGAGRKTMLLAARFADWWNIPDVPVETYAQRLAVLKEHCETIGRDPASLRLTWFGRLGVAKSDAEAVALSGGRWTKQNAIIGTPQETIEIIQRFMELGVDYFMVEVLGLDNPEIRAMVLEDVLPKVKVT
jgi:alkanesulfonate monooxygenase SsuD/methylene tetrahydromethanopterin reductase-like flavin-dependent oxidoreductase (luciferase family)